MRALWLLTPFLVLACGKHTVTTSEASPADAGPAIVSHQSAWHTLAPTTFTRHGVAFEKGELAECDDISLSVPASEAQNGDPLAGFFKADAGVSETTTACDEQFADRTLATCTVELHNESKVITIAAHRYRFADVFESDAGLKECLEMKGRWVAVARDSVEYRHAKLAYDRAELEKLSKQLGN